MKLATTGFTYFVKLSKVIYSRPRVMLLSAAGSATLGRRSCYPRLRVNDFVVFRKSLNPSAWGVQNTEKSLHDF